MCNIYMIQHMIHPLVDNVSDSELFRYVYINIHNPKHICKSLCLTHDVIYVVIMWYIYIWISRCLHNYSTYILCVVECCIVSCVNIMFRVIGKLLICASNTGFDDVQCYITTGCDAYCTHTCLCYILMCVWCICGVSCIKLFISCATS